MNGLSAMNGLNGVNGLSATNGLMTTDAGRKTVAYLVKCALASNDTLVKQDQNGRQLHVPRAASASARSGSTAASPTTGPARTMVSACMMAHINTAGVHVPLWMDSESTAIGWGVSSELPEAGGYVLRQHHR